MAIEYAFALSVLYFYYVDNFKGNASEMHNTSTKLAVSRELSRTIIQLMYSITSVPRGMTVYYTSFSAVNRPMKR